MPNWCTTNITINCENDEKLGMFNKFLDKWMMTNYKRNSFGSGWLGNIVGNSGIGTVDERDETDLGCCGSIVFKAYHDNQLES